MAKATEIWGHLFTTMMWNQSGIILKQMSYVNVYMVHVFPITGSQNPFKTKMA